MRRGRLVTVIVLLALVFVALAHPGAGADYQGSSLYDNVAPETQVAGSLADRYPLNRYGLDYHVKAGVTDTLGVPTGVDVDGIPALIMHALAGVIWDFTRFLLNAVIALFTWAFSLDLVAGSSQTGGAGALAPISRAVQDLYGELGEWLAVAIAAVGGWMAWQVFVRRQIVATFGQLAVSTFMVLVAMLLITQPEWTVGGASKLSNEASLAVLGALNEGDADSAKTDASNQLFDLLIYEPWVVLNFGGLEHCVDGDNRPVKPKSPDCRTLINNKRKYAERWLSAGVPNGKERAAEYNAIREGKTPSRQESEGGGRPRSAFADYQLGDADKPAVDIQQQSMGGERLGYAVLIFVGSLGAVILLGALSIGVILAQVLALLLFAFAPIVLIAAVFPGAGHATWRTWCERLFFAVTRKVWYGLIIAVLLAISSALLDASANLGWLMAFGLQCTFYWAVFLYRKEIYAALTRAWPGSTGAAQRSGPTLGDRARHAYYTSKMLSPALHATGSTATMGLRLGAGAGRAGGRVARAGAQGVGALADDYASRGHATRMTGAASAAAAAVGELEHEHRGDRSRWRQERSRRKRLDELENRDGELSPGERDELAGLRDGRMDDDTYDRLGERVAEVDRRRREGDTPFTEAEVHAKTREIATREAAAARNGNVKTTDGEQQRAPVNGDASSGGDDRAAPQADYERQIDVRGGRDPEFEERMRELERQDERLRKLNEEFDRIIPSSGAPRAKRRGPFGRRRRKKDGGL